MSRLFSSASANRSQCGARFPAELGKSGRGQDITLTCDKSGWHWPSGESQ